MPCFCPTKLLFLIFKEFSLFQYIESKMPIYRLNSLLPLQHLKKCLLLNHCVLSSCSNIPSSSSWSLKIELLFLLTSSLSNIHSLISRIFFLMHKFKVKFNLSGQFNIEHLFLPLCSICSSKMQVGMEYKQNISNIYCFELSVTVFLKHKQIKR